jgi:hypothetical protein
VPEKTPFPDSKHGDLPGVELTLTCSRNRECELGENNWRSGGEAGSHFPATGTPRNDILSQSPFLARSGQARRGDSEKSARLSRTAIQALDESERWIPAFAGMTTFRVRVPGIVIPAKAGIHFPV